MDKGRGGIAMFNRLLGFPEPQSIKKVEPEQTKAGRRVHAQSILGNIFSVSFQRDDPVKGEWASRDWALYAYTVYNIQNVKAEPQAINSRAILPVKYQAEKNIGEHLIALTAWRAQLAIDINKASWIGDLPQQLAKSVIPNWRTNDNYIPGECEDIERNMYLESFWNVELQMCGREQDFWRRAQIDLQPYYITREITRPRMVDEWVAAIKFRIDAEFSTLYKGK